MKMISGKREVAAKIFRGSKMCVAYLCIRYIQLRNWFFNTWHAFIFIYIPYNMYEKIKAKDSNDLMNKKKYIYKYNINFLL